MVFVILPAKWWGRPISVPKFHINVDFPNRIIHLGFEKKNKLSL
jgi:hypothetical protein